MANAKVRYKGMSDVRILPADALKERGVKGIDKDLEFKASNGWSLEVPMSDELMEILNADGAFVVDSGNEVASTGGDDTAKTVVMTDTGQVDKAK